MLKLLISYGFPGKILSFFSASEEMCAFGIPAMRIMSLGFVCGGISTMVATQGALLIPIMWLLNRRLQITAIRNIIA